MSSYLSHYLHRQQKISRRQNLPSLREIKREYVRYLLDITGNNLEEAATILDVPEMSLKKDIAS